MPYTRVYKFDGTLLNLQNTFPTFEIREMISRVSIKIMWLLLWRSTSTDNTMTGQPSVCMLFPAWLSCLVLVDGHCHHCDVSTIMTSSDIKGQVS